MSAVVKAERLTKRYGSSVAVAGIDLAIDQGEIFGLVGPNGAGKTTTLKMLATLLVPNAGDAEIDGHSIRRDPDAVRRSIGYMPDTFGVYDDMRVWEYLDFFGRCYRLPAARRRQMINDLLELVDLAHKREAYVQELSRGMQQRLCLAHALVHDPQVLLLDEPASGLDPRARVELRELLRELRSMGKTILISSHILPELEELCTSLAIIDHGRVLASGRVDEISQRFRAGGVYLLRLVGDDDAQAAEAVLGRRPEVASFSRRPDGTVEIALRGDDEAAAAVLSALVVGGVRVATFSQAASDLEELFLQITEAAPSAAMSASTNGELHA
jgi:ABC-2 type transport system ATP-binding protein